MPARGALPRGPPPADMLAKAKSAQNKAMPPSLPPKSTPNLGANKPEITSGGSSKTAAGTTATVDTGKTAQEIVAKLPKGRKKVKEYVHQVGLQLAVSKQAHSALENELKKMKEERDELKEDFDALNEDFQNVRHDVAKAEKKAEDHLSNVKEMHGDNKEILDSNEALRTLATIAFKGLINIESTLVIASGPITKVGKKGKVDLKDVQVRTDNSSESLKNLRNLKIKLREALIAMNVDIFSEEEKDMMKLVSTAGDDAGIAATKVQSQFRGKQARAEFQEKKEAATKVQSQIRGVQAKKKVAKEKEQKDQAATKVQKIQRGKTSRTKKETKETNGSTVEEDATQNANNSRQLAKSQEKVSKLQAKLGKQKNELEILKRENKMLRNAGAGGGSGGRPAVTIPVNFEDEETQREASEAAVKIQSQIRGKQTKKDFEKNKDTLKYEKDRDSLVRKARRSEALEIEVKRLRDKLVETTMDLDGALDRGRKEARQEYEKELARRERSSIKDDNDKGSGVDIQMFEATAQELDMAQTKLAQTRSDLEQERKRNMRLHRLRMAAEEEIEKAKETLNILAQESERERQRSEE
jgi:hypothetical protein